MVKRLLIPLLVIVGILTPATPAFAQAVNVSIVSPATATITAGTQQARGSLSLQASVGQVIRFRVDPAEYWDSGAGRCYYFDKWITSWGDLYARETNYTVHSSHNAIVAAYKSTTQWWYHPGCYF
jgi:hypothetical protein